MARQIMSEPSEGLADRVRALEAELAELRASAAEREGRYAQAAAWLRRISDAMPVLISYVDRDQVFRFANKAYEGRFRRSLDTIVGRTVGEVMGPEVYEARRPYIERALAGEAVTYEVPFPTSEGQLLTRVEHIPNRNRAGEVLGFYALVQDVTEQRRQEQALRESEARLRLLTGNLPGAFVYQTVSSADMLERRYTYVSDNCERMIGVTAEAAMADSNALMGLMPPEQLPAILEAERAAAQTLSTFELELSARAANGRFLHARIVSQPRPAGDGRVIWDGMVLDMTDRHVAETKLQETEDRFRRIADSAPVPMWVTGLDRRRQFANRAYCAFVGAPYEEALAFDWRTVLHPDDAPRIYAEQVAKEASLQPFTLEARYRRADGEWRWLRSESQPRWGPQGEHAGFIGVAYDVTEAKQAQEDLQQINELLEARVAERTAELQALYDKAPVPLHSQNPDGVLISVSDRWLEFMGYDSRDQVLGRKAAEFLTEASRRRHLEEYWPRLVARGFADDVEYEAVKRSGEVAEVLISSRLGRDSEGRFVRTMGAVVDVTARNRAEAQLRQAQKMDAMGQLTGGVAHDFNNLLTPIIGSLELLRERVGDDARASRLADGGLEAAERAATLVQRLLAFSRQQRLEPRPTDIVRLVDGVRELIARTIGPDIRIVVDAPDDLPSALVDPNQLELALLNLAVNARDAMPAGGELRIQVDGARIEDENAGPALPGDYVRLAVIDTGTGMDAATLARAVEPFYSTKAVGQGTGLGLSMVHGLAAQSGGALQLTSAPGEGTRAELWLPVASSAAAGRAATTTPPAFVGGVSATVLLVDDEPLVRRSIGDMLRDLGCAVVEAGDGEEALRLLEERPDVELLVTDHLMPGLKGAELARRAADLRADLPVLLLTGYVGEAIDPTLPRLNKPVRSADLARAIAGLRKASDPAETTAGSR